MHEKGYTFYTIAGLTLFEIKNLIDIFVEMNKTPDERKKEEREMFYKKLIEMNYENGKYKNSN